MRQIKTTCSCCNHQLSVDASHGGASVTCPQCAKEVIIPLGDPCPKCGSNVDEDQEICGECRYQAGISGTMKSRLKTAFTGVLMSIGGGTLGYFGMWRPLETGIQTIHIGTRSRGVVHDATRDTDPIEFWLTVAGTSLFGAILIAMGVAITIGGLRGKGRVTSASIRWTRRGRRRQLGMNNSGRAAAREAN